MKTIKQASEWYAGINDDKSSNLAIVYDKYDLATAFISGIEFAQRWISVENELPEKYQNVLLKEDSGSIYVGFYGGNSKLPICRATESRLIAITHWRPINLE